MFKDSGASGGGNRGTGGDSRGRHAAKATRPARLDVRTTLVERGEGFEIRKTVTVDLDRRAEAGATSYALVFNGHDPMVFGYLKAAREQAKIGPPAVAAAVPEAAPAEPTETAGPAVEASDAAAV